MIEDGIFCSMGQRTDEFIIDFRKDWQRRVRVHFDQVRNRNHYLHESHYERHVSIVWGIVYGFTNLFPFYSLAASTAVVRPVLQRPPLLLLVRLTSCVPLCVALPSSTTAVSVPVVDSLSLS